MKHPKQKGNSFERKVAKILSEWSGEEFHRTPMSGGLHWSNDKRVVSDIVPPNSMKFPFSIECKNVEYLWEFSGIIEGKSLFWEHWKQAVSDSQQEELRPMLVFTKNYRNVFAAILESDFEKLNKVKPASFNYISVFSTNGNCKIFLLQEFLQTYDLKTIQML